MAFKISVDLAARRIMILPQAGPHSIDVKTDIYSDMKEMWKANLNGEASFLFPLRTTGGDPISATLDVGAYFFLRNDLGWRIQPHEVYPPGGVHEIVLTGNLYPEDSALSMFAPPETVGTVVIHLETSSLTQVAVVEGGAGGTDWTAGERAQIRDALGVDGTKSTAAGGQVQAVKAKTDSLTFTIAGKVDASIQAAGDLAQAAADKVWASAARTLMAFAFAVDILQSAADKVWASATRTLTDVTAAVVNAIKAKTDQLAFAPYGAGVVASASFGGTADANVVAIDGVAVAAQNLSRSAALMVPGSVDDAMFTPTTTQFESTVALPLENLLLNRIVFWATGALAKSAYEVKAYKVFGGRGRFTVANGAGGPMVGAPSNGDQFVVL